MMDLYLVPEKTKVTAKGDSAPIDVLGLSNHVLLLTLHITDVIEQESLDVSIYGSADGTTWTEKPLISFPQKFYRGEHPLLLDLSDKPDVKMLRAHWEVARWGRGTDTPMFEFEVRVREVPANMLAKA
jgi:hypothetical protein